MKDILSLQQKVIPEMLELLSKRYQLLKSIYYNQPIGRRGLSQALNIGERIVRSEVNFLKNQGLVDINSIGMMVTKDGENILAELEKMIHSINGIASMEESLKKQLNIKKVIIIPGDLENDFTVLQEMGRVTAEFVKKLINDKSVIAITGGGSVAQVIENFPKIEKDELFVVPARGGMGRNIETQASTLAEKLAKKNKCKL